MKRIVKEKKSNKTIIAISIFFAVTFVCVFVCGFLLIGSTRSDSKYNRLVNNISNVSRSNIEQIKKDLRSLSSNFKDVGEIKKQYEEIEYEIRYIEAYYGQISNLKEDFSEHIRLYYYNIYQFDEKYDNWNLKTYLSEVNIVQLIFGKYWTRNINTANGLYIKWCEENKKMTLTTNIPNKIESGKEYTYGVKYTPEESNSVIIFYTNKNDKQDSFNAYRLSNFRIENKEFCFDAECIKNETLYTFSTKISF